ncbi:Uncharacterised protein [Mycobacteroides abscessus subsp. abscessus]|nr:Uncharacterised protein [Mycobacteroides abscessus subsp. abscessus]
MVVHQVGGEGVHKQDLLAGFRVNTYHRVLGVGVSLVQFVTLSHRHGGAEAGLDRMPSPQVAYSVAHGGR